MISGRLDDFEALGLDVLGAATRRAVDWIRSLSVQPAVGEVDLGGEVSGRILRYRTGDAAASRFESHRRFVDLQYTLAGCEVLEWSPRAALGPDGDYDAGGDLLFHQPDMVMGRIVAGAGCFTIFTPLDAHRGGIRDGLFDGEVCKLVVKIPVAEFPSSSKP